jgi:hypothetical protein
MEKQGFALQNNLARSSIEGSICGSVEGRIERAIQGELSCPWDLRHPMEQQYLPDSNRLADFCLGRPVEYTAHCGRWSPTKIDQIQRSLRNGAFLTFDSEWSNGSVLAKAPSTGNLHMFTFFII